MASKNTKDIAAIFEEGTLIDQALEQAVKEAYARHKRLGQPIVVWEDGKIVWIPAEEIPVDESLMHGPLPDDWETMT